MRRRRRRRRQKNCARTSGASASLSLSWQKETEEADEDWEKTKGGRGARARHTSHFRGSDRRRRLHSSFLRRGTAHGGWSRRRRARTAVVLLKWSKRVAKKACLSSGLFICISKRTNKYEYVPLTHSLTPVFIRGYKLKKESKTALKKVDLSLFFPPKKYQLTPQNKLFNRNEQLKMGHGLHESALRAN